MMEGKAIPQPVEYLESDGNQWFDIEIPYGSNTGVYMDYMLVQSNSARGFFGATRTGTNYTSDLGLIVTGSSRQRMDRYGRSSSEFALNIAQRQNFTFNPKGNVSASPYRYYSSISGYLRQADTWYSSAYQSIDNKFGVFHKIWNIGGSQGLYPVAMRLYNLELREYTSAIAYTTTLKLTPVSVGGVGAMLDEISGTLHFNQGTGAFILPS